MHSEGHEIGRWEDDGGYCLGAAQSTVREAVPLGTHSSIYEVLFRHQVSENWDDRDLLEWLHRWAKIFASEFKLQISVFALTVDWLRRNCLGHFRRGHNGFGLKAEIAINRRHLRREPWRILGTLLHELLHAEQEEHGKPGKGNYHNKAFRERAAEFGLIIDQYGHTQYAPASRFKALLATDEIEMPELPPPIVLQPGNSKLKRWMCPCGVRVRVAVADFRAQCLRCQGMFVRTES